MLSIIRRIRNVCRFSRISRGKEERAPPVVVAERTRAQGRGCTAQRPGGLGRGLKFFILRPRFLRMCASVSERILKYVRARCACV